MDEHEVFFVKARHCKRCGGLLTSAQAIKDGYGFCCKKKAEAEAAEIEISKDQLSMFDVIEEIEK